jgi:hypothetical protein
MHWISFLILLNRMKRNKTLDKKTPKFKEHFGV